MSIEDTLRKEIRPEQILAHFGYDVSARSILCPFHNDTDPSLHIYADVVYCFSEREAWDIFSLVRKLLYKHHRQSLRHADTIEWLQTTELKPSSLPKAGSSTYMGAVPTDLITYWHNQMRDEHYALLDAERGITRPTADYFGIGWRPDYQAFALPFWRGIPFQSKVDTVQFRIVNNPNFKSKYIGLKHYARGAIMNAELLQQAQPYLLVLFGSFDPILAHQDGILAVGTNGANPFKKLEKERVQELFQYQHNITIIPDNSPGEFSAAYALAEWLDARVRFYPEDSEPGMDYINYRKAHAAHDFLSLVADVAPLTAIDLGLVEDIHTLLDAGDTYKLADVHTMVRGRGIPASDLAKALALQACPPNFTFNSWNKVQKSLFEVRSLDELLESFDLGRQLVYNMNGAW